jgi:hypothetical protein
MTTPQIANDHRVIHLRKAAVAARYRSQLDPDIAFRMPPYEQNRPLQLYGRLLWIVKELEAEVHELDSDCRFSGLSFVIFFGILPLDIHFNLIPVQASHGRYGISDRLLHPN